MDVEVFCLCRSTSVNEFDEPTLVGLFDTKLTRTTFVRMHPFAVALQLRIYRKDEGQHKITVSMQHSDKQEPLMPMVQLLSIQELTRDSITMFYCFNVPPCALRLGEYIFSLQIGDKQYARTSLFVLQTQ